MIIFWLLGQIFTFLFIVIGGLMVLGAVAAHWTAVCVFCLSVFSFLAFVYASAWESGK